MKKRLCLEADNHRWGNGVGRSTNAQPSKTDDTAQEESSIHVRPAQVFHKSQEFVVDLSFRPMVDCPTHPMKGTGASLMVIPVSMNEALLHKPTTGFIGDALSYCAWCPE